MGITGHLLWWLSDFLRAIRRQRVVLGEHASGWVDVTSGVPQGSVLGPTLFIAYVNDLPKVINKVSKLYADNCKIIAKVDSLNDCRIL